MYTFRFSSVQSLLIYHSHTIAARRRGRPIGERYCHFKTCCRPRLCFFLAVRLFWSLCMLLQWYGETARRSSVCIFIRALRILLLLLLYTRIGYLNSKVFERYFPHYLYRANYRFMFYCGAMYAFFCIFVPYNSTILWQKCQIGLKKKEEEITYN